MSMNPEDEVYAQQLIERMKMQNKMMNPSSLPYRNPESVSGDMNVNNISNQAVLNSVKSTPPPAPATGAFDICSQCGTMHPPIEQGKICPIVNLKNTKESSGLSEDSITQFVSNLRNIAMSQIASKKIKDGNKLFKHLTINFMKSLEEYKE